MDDRILIDRFIEHLAKGKYPGVELDRRPDEENRVAPEIDAMAGSLAIEHTSVDSIPAQRRNSEWFMQAVGGLEDDIGSLPFRLNVTLKYEAVTTGQNWTAIRRAMKDWIEKESIPLSDGVHLMTAIPGIPFDFTVRKSCSREPGIFFARVVPDESKLVERVRSQIDRKVEKLLPYKQTGLTTVLLIENEDVALMNEIVMRKAVEEAYPKGLPEAIDELWYADTSLSSDIAFYEFTPYFRRAKR
jgi:hypothetical protein